MIQRVRRSSEYNNSISTLRFFLMPFVCISLFGFPGEIGLVSSLSLFVFPAFFILFGFIDLPPKEEVRSDHLMRGIKRSAICFGILFVCYFLVNAVYLTVTGVNWIPPVLSKRILFNFFVLNLWPFPIGASIWFVQSLLYAYALLYFLNQKGLLQYYKILLVISMLFMLLVGEFAGVIHFHVLGYDYIPGGALTRALPYMLLGMLFREKADQLPHIPPIGYWGLFFLGAILSVVETILLAQFRVLLYEGHTIGYGIMAASICAWTFAHTEADPSFFSRHGSSYSVWIYATAPLIHFAFMMIVGNLMPQYLGIANAYGGVIVYVLSLLLSMVIVFMIPRVSKILGRAGK